MMLRRHLPLALAAGAAAEANAARTRRARVGEVVAVVGEAVARFSGDAPRDLRPVEPLLLDDLISTGPAARLVGRLLGDLEFRLGEQASLRVDALTLHGPASGTALRVFGGPVLLDRPTGKSAAPITVSLPWARIGVRGTRFFAGLLDGRHAVFVARGQVEVAASGTTVLLSAGEGVDLPSANAPPGPVVRWGQGRIDRALALVN